MLLLFDTFLLTVILFLIGVGISAADLASAGEPFWTTKPPGRGMGLGLFLVRATLEQIGGRLHRKEPRQP